MIHVRTYVYSFLCAQLHLLPLPLPSFLRSDFPSLFVSLIEDPPWTRLTDKGETEKYSEGSWKVVPHEDRLQLTKLEAQVSRGTLLSVITQTWCTSFTPPLLYMSTKWRYSKLPHPQPTPLTPHLASLSLVLVYCHHTYSLAFVCLVNSALAFYNLLVV